MASEENKFERVDDDDDGGGRRHRTIEPCYTLSAHCEPSAQMSYNKTIRSSLQARLCSRVSLNHPSVAKGFDFCICFFLF